MGFALGLADFIFLALFAALARRLEVLRPLPTLAFGCAAVLLAMLAGLLLIRPLTALPFIALSFVLANAEPLYEALSKADEAQTLAPASPTAVNSIKFY